ncbi:MAG: SUMF1/EgtB/PvdO family nonheme iron enzyme [Chloroflexi bacterium]|uniref:SUMF1/EgtB/PvdO family nonheme iron enzyme n=1 Tax=Candidatus Flexifilum breve TaxID=3140694 RepID=UPI003134B585|nr:SUMF1/EgtB/PvdO family nonheme iron enzyme [Chloroflexota bacterium]
MAHIFISYKHQDTATLKSLLDALIDTDMKVWLDHDLRIFDLNWAHTINQVVDEAAVFILMFDDLEDELPHASERHNLSLLYVSRARSACPDDCPPYFEIDSHRPSDIDRVCQYIKNRNNPSMLGLFARVNAELARYERRGDPDPIRDTSIIGERTKHYLEAHNRTAASLAQQLDLDENLLNLIIAGEFPLDELSGELIGEIAEVIGCQVEEITELVTLPEDQDVLPPQQSVLELLHWLNEEHHDLSRPKLVEHLLQLMAQNRDWKSFEQICYWQPVSAAKALLNYRWNLSDHLVERFRLSWDKYLLAQPNVDHTQRQLVYRALSLYNPQTLGDETTYPESVKTWWLPITFEIEDHIRQQRYFFWLAKYPVTKSAYQEFLNTAGQMHGWTKQASVRGEISQALIEHNFSNNWESGLESVESTYANAAEFCRWLNQYYQLDGYNVRLPSLQEWESVGKLRVGVQTYPFALTSTEQREASACYSSIPLIDSAGIPLG